VDKTSPALRGWLSVNVSFKPREADNALGSAAWTGDVKSIEKVIQSGWVIDIPYEDGWTPLHVAAWNLHADVVELFLSNFVCSVWDRNAEGSNVIDIATENDDDDTIRILQNASEHEREIVSVCHAAERGDCSRIEELKAQGVDLSAQNPLGWTPLMIAARNGHADVVKMLLELGGESHAISAVWYAIKGEAINILNSFGVKVSELNCFRVPLTHLAASEGHVRTIKTLHGFGADFKARDYRGWTPLHRAAFYGHVNAIQLLNELGADIASRDNDGCTAMHHAVESGKVGVVKCLKELGASVSARDNQGQTPIHSAAYLGRINIIEELKGLGGDLSLGDENGYTALDVAVKEGHLETANLLRT